MSTHLQNAKAISRAVFPFLDVPDDELKDVTGPRIADGQLINDGLLVCSLFPKQVDFLSLIVLQISGADLYGFGAMLHAWNEKNQGDERHYLLDILIAFFERLADQNVVLSDDQAELVQRYFLHGNPLPGLAKINQSVRGTVDWLLDKVVYFKPMEQETAKDLAELHGNLVRGNANSKNAHQLVHRHGEAFKEKYNYPKDVALFKPSDAWYVYSH